MEQKRRFSTFYKLELTMSNDLNKTETINMTDRFDLEQQILGCWGIVDEIKLLIKQVLENDDFDKDKIANFLLGLETIYGVKFDQLFTTFETLVKDKKIV